MDENSKYVAEGHDRSRQGARKRHQTPKVMQGLMFNSVQLPMPQPTLREAVWRHILVPYSAPGTWAADLGRRFRPTPAQIRDAVTAAALEVLGRTEPAHLVLGYLADTNTFSVLTVRSPQNLGARASSPNPVSPPTPPVHMGNSSLSRGSCRRLMLGLAEKC
ncbi:hypothetical protein [Saccharopolyspora sp. NPDC002376]